MYGQRQFPGFPDAGPCGALLVGPYALNVLLVVDVVEVV
jgi:hypothetical protein